MTYDLGEDSKLNILAVSERGAILSIERGSFKVILPVGVDFDTLDELEKGPDIGPVTALLLSESGYAPSNPPAWLAKVKPGLVIISVKAGDPNGLPTADLLEELSDFNVARTDFNGWIDLSSDGKQIWVTAENK
jgi:beta-lactamase superfamily II metal-dependent hydrolase